ncbi:MAG: outer membrane lipoprotein-sorting protein [endosymbiont of Seepiophila jonesi]|uniref:Outer membrane lipoprotein-sorting protein n=1 Tax=endosymbiont of Lamellibrachia luymesi TaxID=2200907 RepID=A0A370DNH7_9GAMM|nr:MAG: outer membrane lipoprotein-sorting protein [endosymbiont of Lamellibrachia luymesi]RDH91225.1 MAG: outer membrane lipoprotein-sorting protein [endosymbiont of Seepiophila jonesi]
MRYVFLLLWLLPAALPLHAQDAQQLLQEVDRRMQPESYEMYRKLINIEPDGDKKAFVLYTVKKGNDKMLALFLDPPSEKGRATLRLADNMRLYIPDVGRPLRITSLQSVVGGVFNNSDVMRLDFSAEYHAESVKTEDGAYLLELKAKSNSVAYDRLKMWVDKEARVPVRIEAYAASGLQIKTLHYSKIKDFGNGIVRPAMLETDSPLHKGYKSVMLFSGVKPRDFSDEVFSLSFMSKAGELRE